MLRYTNEQGSIVEFSRPSQAESLARAIARALGPHGFVILAVSDGQPPSEPAYRSGWWGPLDHLRLVAARLKEDIEPLYALSDASDGSPLAGPRPEFAAMELAKKIAEMSGRPVQVTNVRTQAVVTVSKS
jgi:hypothetical protein